MTSPTGTHVPDFLDAESLAEWFQLTNADRRKLREELPDIGWHDDSKDEKSFLSIYLDHARSDSGFITKVDKVIAKLNKNKIHKKTFFVQILTKCRRDSRGFKPLSRDAVVEELCIFFQEKGM